MWEDAWLPGKDVHVTPIPKNESNPDVHMQVNELIDFENGCWNSSLIADMFSKDQNLILEISLSQSWPTVKRYWWPTSDGTYTVKSGYWLGRLGHMRICDLFFGGAENELWKIVWNLEGLPKLSHFLWRACKGSLAMMDVLYKCHMRPNKICPVCGLKRRLYCMSNSIVNMHHKFGDIVGLWT